MIWVAIAAIVWGVGLAFFANWQLELGQRIGECLDCGVIWAAGMLSMFILGLSMV